MTRVGFVGLGSQGGPMARRIVEAGFDTTLWGTTDGFITKIASTAPA